MGAPLKIDLLGPPQVWVEDLPLPKLRSRKALWLLAYLTLHDGGPVSRERLAFALWPDAESSVGLSNLRSVVSELRQALGGQRERLAAPDRNTLRLDLRDVEVDVSEFDRAIRDQRHERAIEIYRSELLEGCPEEWVAQERRVRQEHCLSALLSLGDEAVKTKGYERAVLLYQRAMDLDPWRDAAQRGMMAALAGSGEVNGALQAYREFAHRLSRDAGLSPDERTTELYLALRSKDQRPKKDRDQEVARRPASAVGSVPRPLSRLVGREDERADVVAKLRLSRLVTLTGVGGVGKTRLAIEVAEETRPIFLDGAWFVALDALHEAGQVTQAISAVLDVKEESGVALIETVIGRLRDKRALIVLDNCEHLLDGTATVCNAILRECGNVRILATSREALGLLGESVWLVPGLSVPDPAHLPANRSTRTRMVSSYEGVALFVERAQSVAPNFALDPENAAMMVEICSRLEGIPLAIELTAVQLGSMSVASVAERLYEILKPLSTGRSVGHPRQQTMRSTLDWSYGLLSVVEREALKRLSVFVGGWTLEAATAVLGEEAAAWLRSLVGKSLMVYDLGTDRYRMLEPVRQYAAARLEEAGQTDLARTRHQEWFVSFSEEAEPMLQGPGQQHWLRRLREELDNLRSAMEWPGSGTKPSPGLRIVAAIWQYWFVKGESEEGFQRLRHALDRSEEMTLARSKALLGAGKMRFCQTRFTEAHALYQQGLSIAEHIGDRLAAAALLSALGTAAAVSDDRAAQEAYFQRALEIYRDRGDLQGVARTLGNLGVGACLRGEAARARPMFLEGLGYAESAGDLQCVAWMHHTLGQIEDDNGDYLAARMHHEESLRFHEEVDSKRGIAMALHNLGAIRRKTRDPDGARSLLERAIELFREVSDRQGEAEILCALAELGCEVRDESPALSLISQSLDIFRELDDPINAAGALKVRAKILRRQGQLVDAESAMHDCLRVLLASDRVPLIVDASEEMGAVLWERDEQGRAGRLWGIANGLRESRGIPVPPVSKESLTEWRAQAASFLGEEEYTRAKSDGAAPDWHGAIATLLLEA